MFFGNDGLPASDLKLAVEPADELWHRRPMQHLQRRIEISFISELIEHQDERLGERTKSSCFPSGHSVAQCTRFMGIVSSRGQNPRTDDVRALDGVDFFNSRAADSGGSHAAHDRGAPHTAG